MATTVTCSFITTRGAFTPFIDGVRTREDVSVSNGTTTNAALDGESILVVNGTATAVAIATGSVPDAATTVETPVSCAGFGLPSNTSLILPAETGDKVNVKTIA